MSANTTIQTEGPFTPKTFLGVTAHVPGWKTAYMYNFGPQLEKAYPPTPERANPNAFKAYDDLATGLFKSITPGDDGTPSIWKFGPNKGSLEKTQNPALTVYHVCAGKDESLKLTGRNGKAPNSVLALWDMDPHSTKPLEVKYHHHQGYKQTEITSHAVGGADSEAGVVKCWASKFTDNYGVPMEWRFRSGIDLGHATLVMNPDADTPTTIGQFRAVPGWEKEDRFKQVPDGTLLFDLPSQIDEIDLTVLVLACYKGLYLMRHQRDEYLAGRLRLSN